MGEAKPQRPHVVVRRGRANLRAAGAERVEENTHAISVRREESVHIAVARGLVARGSDAHRAFPVVTAATSNFVRP